jgi:hypothetical protein
MEGWGKGVICKNFEIIGLTPEGRGKPPFVKISNKINYLKT